MNDRFRVYTSPDIVGVELSGALKNVVALACGICDGMGYQDNNQSPADDTGHGGAVPSGSGWGRSTDLRRPCGYGDLIVTCTSYALPEPPGGHPAGILRADAGGDRRRGGGYYAAASMHQLAEKTGVEMPICRCVYEILYRQRPVQEVARELMGRARKGEIEDGWRYPVG